MIRDALDPIEMLDKMIEEGADIYEAAVSIGLQDEGEMTVRRWRQGDLVARLEKHYGESILKKYAVALAVNASTLKQRRTMSQFYEKDTRYLFENVGYSHYREAMRLENLEEAVKILQRASDEDMPVWVLKKAVDECLGKEEKPTTSIPGMIERIFERDGKCIVEMSIALEDVEFIRGFKDIQIKVK